MDLRNYCVQDYQEYIALSPINSELKRALKAHERVPLFIDRLVGELSRVRVHLDREEIKRVVYDLTKVFVANVQRVADEKHMSAIQKQVLIAKDDERKEFSRLADLLDGGTENVERTEKGETTRATVAIEV